MSSSFLISSSRHFKLCQNCLQVCSSRTNRLVTALKLNFFQISYSSFFEHNKKKIRASSSLRQSNLCTTFGTQKYRALLTGCSEVIYAAKFKTGAQKCGRCRQVVTIWRLSLTQVGLYIELLSGYFFNCLRTA